MWAATVAVPPPPPPGTKLGRNTASLVFKSRLAFFHRNSRDISRSRFTDERRARNVTCTCYDIKSETRFERE